MKRFISQCDHTLLERSLIDRLSEREEEQLAAHLSECVDCRSRLDALAGNADSWTDITKALQIESKSDSKNWSQSSPTKSIYASSIEDVLDLDSSSALNNSDFVVDFLQPTDAKDALGRLGTIEIRQFIGQGAHGVVFKGFQEELNRFVAVKMMAPHLATVVAARKRFAREARAAAAIVHPNVMPILLVDSSGQLPYLVMPYVDCESLQQRLDREGALPLLDVLRIALQGARALEAAHAQGLVHRDVKPANILLERSIERVMLTDFGLARAVDDATLTCSGFIAGTPHFMSPEQAKGDPIDTSSDLFSLGSVLYAMCTGRPPFRAESTYGILRRVTDDTPRAIRELNAEVPDWLESIVQKLLSKLPANRFESAKQLAEILEACVAHAQQPSTVPLPEHIQKLRVSNPTTTKVSTRVVQKFALPILLMVTVVALFAFLGPSLFRDTQRRETPPIETQRSNVPDSIPPTEVTTDVLSQTSSTAERPDASPIEPWRDGIDQSLNDLNHDLDNLQRMFVEPSPQ